MLYRHGGIYADADVMHLRDLGELAPVLGPQREFCYSWSADQPSYGRFHRELDDVMRERLGIGGPSYPP